MAELNKNLSEITDDLGTLTAMTEVIAQAVTDAVSSGILDSNVIADRVADAVSQAMRDGIIDAANLLVESDVAVDMIHAAVSAIDFESITNSLVNSKNVSLTAAEIQLASQEALYAI